jgi:hypothetical protein
VIRSCDLGDQSRDLVQVGDPVPMVGMDHRAQLIKVNVFPPFPTRTGEDGAGVSSLMAASEGGRGAG